MAKVKLVKIFRKISCYKYEGEFFQDPISIEPMSYLDVFSILAARGDISAFVMVEKLKRPAHFNTTIRKELDNYFAENPAAYINLIQQTKNRQVHMPVIVTVFAMVPEVTLENSMSRFEYRTDWYLIKNNSLFLAGPQNHTLQKEVHPNLQLKWFSDFFDPSAL